MVKNLPANAGDMGSIPGSESPLGEEVATHFTILTRGAWWATVHGVTKESDTTQHD